MRFNFDIKTEGAFQERHWTSPAIASAIEAATSAPQSDRLKQSLKIAPHLLDVYFAIALRDVNDCMRPLPNSFSLKFVIELSKPFLLLK